MYLGWAPGPWEIILVVLVVLLLFGGRKIPELMRGIGKGVKEFKEGIAEDDKNDSDDSKDKKEDK
jgi:sec-independent protein translocase protein TatA